uniref:Mitochondrial ribosomal protein L54 n=1 Tax=Acrobeloides nanus TaxID=290746 RepID=A0A914BWT0_9BILA
MQRFQSFLPHSQTLKDRLFYWKNDSLVVNAIRAYAVSRKVVPQKEKPSKIVVDKDTQKLCQFACIDYKVNSTSPGPILKANNQYPDWLFKLRLPNPKPLEELDPEKDGWLYWKALRKRQVEEKRFRMKLKFRYIDLQDSPSKRKFNEADKFGNFL